MSTRQGEWTRGQARKPARSLVRNDPGCNRESVADLIEPQFGIDVGIEVSGKYLRRLTDLPVGAKNSGLKCGQMTPNRMPCSGNQQLWTN